MPLNEDIIGLPELGLEEIRMGNKVSDFGLNEIFDKAIELDGSVRFLRLAGPKEFREKVIAFLDENDKLTTECKKLRKVENVEFILTNPYSESFLTRMDAERKDNWNIWRVRDDILKFAEGLMKINKFRSKDGRKPIKIAFHCMDLVWNLSIVENQHVIARAYYKSASGHDRNVAEVHLCTGKGSRIAESFISYYDSVKNDKRTQFIKYGEPDSSQNSLRESLGKWPSLFKCNSIHIDDENDEYFVKTCCSKHGMLAERKVFLYQSKSQQVNGYFKPVEGTIIPHEESYGSRILKINGVLATELLWHAQQAFIHNSDLKDDLEQLVGSIVCQAFSALNEFRDIGKQEIKLNENMVPYPWEKNIHDALSEAGRFLHLTQQELSKCSNELLKIANKSGRQSFRDAHLKNRIIRFDRNNLSNNYENFHKFFENIKENDKTIYDWLKNNTYDIDFETGCWLVSEWDDVFHILWSNSLGWNLSEKLDKEFEFVKTWYKAPESEKDKEEFWGTLLCRSLREYCRRIWYDHVMPRTYSQRYKLERRDHFLELAKTALNHLQSYNNLEENNSIQKFLDDCTKSGDDLWNCPMNHKHLFCWDSVTENENLNENHILKNYLIDYHGINWVENAKIKKSKNGEKIWVTSEYLIEWDKIPKNHKLSKDDEYLFSWDEIPGQENGRLKEFIKQNYNIDWVDTTEIEKIDDGRTIRISTEKKYLSLKLNDEKTKVNLIIDDGRTDEFIAKTESSKLNIYDNDNLKLIDFLNKIYCIDWIKTAIIEKKGNIVTLSNEKKSLCLIFEDAKLIIEIDGNRIDEFDATKKNIELKLKMFSKMELQKNTENAHLVINGTIIETFKIEKMQKDKLYIMNNRLIEPKDKQIVAKKLQNKNGPILPPYNPNKVKIKQVQGEIEVDLKEYDFKYDKCTNCFKVAIVQLKYDLYKVDDVLTISKNFDVNKMEYYKNKILKIIKHVNGKADIVIFPEFSIPFDLLDELKECSNKNNIIIIAGSHYVIDTNLEKYEALFGHKFTDDDLRKNISPIIIPQSEFLLYTEKVLGAKIERELFDQMGMTPGKLNWIFKYSNNVTFGVMICFDFINDDFRNGIVERCNIIFVPQTNSGTKRFHDICKSYQNNRQYPGIRAFIMASGIFTFNGGSDIEGGDSGVFPTLDKQSNNMRSSSIVESVNNVKEQFIQIAHLNMVFDGAMDIGIGQTPIKTELIHIFEKNEIIRLNKAKADEFLKVLNLIKKSNKSKKSIDAKALKNLLKEKEAVIKFYSPLMHSKLYGNNLVNKKINEIKGMCRAVVV